MELLELRNPVVVLPGRLPLVMLLTQHEAAEVLQPAFRLRAEPALVDNALEDDGNLAGTLIADVEGAHRFALGVPVAFQAAASRNFQKLRQRPGR